jgi:hypothetical protein
MNVITGTSVSDLLEDRQCSPQCLLARNSRQGCGCRCRGQFHSRLAGIALFPADLPVLAVAKSGAITVGLVVDAQRIFAGTIERGHWRCECGLDIRRESYIGPPDVCRHLRAIGNLPRAEAMQ